MTIIEKKFDEYSEIKKIPSGLVTYLFKLKDNRLCVCTQDKNILIYKFENNNLIKQFSIPNYQSILSKITQLKNGLILFQTNNNEINFIEISEKTYEIKYKLKFDKNIVKNLQNIIKILELKDGRIAILINDYQNDKLCFINYCDLNYQINTYIYLYEKDTLKLSLDFEEIPKLNQIVYYSNKGLFFYDLKTYELKKKMNNLKEFEWTNSLLLFNEDYLILGSIFASCNEGEKNVYLVKCSTYEIIDSFCSNDFDYMFCTSIKLLNNNSILFGFHMYDGYTQFLQIKIENEKIVFVCLKRISNNQFDGEICGIEEFNEFIIVGNRDGFIHLYK
jgi:hypothetical protein